MINFGLHDLARTVIAIADEQPDTVYTNPDTDADLGDGFPPRCKYRHNDGSCGCIYGHALVRLGMDITALPNAAINRHLARWFGGLPGDDVYHPFRDVQVRQDMGIPWGTAVSQLRLHYPPAQ